MNLPSISESDLTPHLPALQDLMAQGWSPCINVLKDKWHVGLSHSSLPTPTMEITDSGVKSNWDGSPLTIHAKSRSLFTALDQAIAQAQETTVS